MKCLIIVSKPYILADLLDGWAEFERSVNPGGMFEEVHVLSVDDDHNYSDAQGGGSLRIAAYRRRWYDRLVRFPFAPVYASLKAALLARMLIKRHGIRLLVNIEGNILDNGIPTVWASRLTGIPSVVTVMNDNGLYFRFESFYLRSRLLNMALERHVLRLATRIRCVSPYLVRYVEAQGADPRKTMYLPLRAYTDYLEKTAMDSGKILARLGLAERLRGRKTILTPARFTPQKNLLNMIRGFQMAVRKDPALFYLIVGSGPLKPQILQFIEGQGLQPHMAVLDWMPLAELKALYLVSDLILLVSYYEGMPRTVQEALALGIPVIGSDRGHFHGIVDEGRNGFTVSPDSPEAIGAILNRVLSDPEGLARLKRGARESSAPLLDGPIEAQERALYDAVMRNVLSKAA